MGRQDLAWHATFPWQHTPKGLALTIVVVSIAVSISGAEVVVSVLVSIAGSEVVVSVHVTVAIAPAQDSQDQIAACTKHAWVGDHNNMQSGGHMHVSPDVHHAFLGHYMQ